METDAYKSMTKEEIGNKIKEVTTKIEELNEEIGYGSFSLSLYKKSHVDELKAEKKYWVDQLCILTDIVLAWKVK
jgi:hypothetical protein